MTVAFFATDLQKDEVLSKEIPHPVNIIWADTLKALYSISADAYFDLMFEFDNQRIQRLKKLLPAPVVVNSVIYSLRAMNAPFIRINGWPTMLRRPVSELALVDPGQEQIIETIFQELHWNYQLVPDIPGMITPRVIASIINEAYFALEDKISTREEIDIAMKLGTNYPLGPFEWSKAIGLKNIYELLHLVSKAEPKYEPSKILMQEANQFER